MNITRTPGVNCVVCKTYMDATAPSDGRDSRPGPGDVTICLKCGAFMVFTDDMSVRGISHSEFVTLDPYIQAELMRTWFFINIRKPKGRMH